MQSLNRATHLFAAREYLARHKAELIIATMLFFEVLFFGQLSKIPFFGHTSGFALIVFLTGYSFFFVSQMNANLEDARQRTVGLFLLLLITLCIFYFCISSSKDSFDLVALLLLLPSTLFVGNPKKIEQPEATWNWHYSFLATFIEAGLASLIFVRVVPFWSLIFSVVFLIRITKQRQTNNHVISVLLRFLVVPLWLYYVLLSNFYVVKHLIKWSFPSMVTFEKLFLTFFLYIIVWWSLPHLQPKTSLWPPAKLITLAKWLHVPIFILMVMYLVGEVYIYPLSNLWCYQVLPCTLFGAALMLDLLGRLSFKRFLLIFWTLGLASFLPLFSLFTLCGQSFKRLFF